MIDSCTSCLRRAFLIAHLAPRIAGLLGGRERRASGLLALPEDELLAAAAGEGVEQALAFLEELDTDIERERLSAGGFSVLCTHATGYPPLLRQLARLAGSGVLCNGDMDGRLTRRQVPLEASLAGRLLAVRDRIPLSGRGHDRVLRVARTIADLDARELLDESDVDEALSYRLDSWERIAA